jgi:hypothetical protein
MKIGPSGLDRNDYKTSKWLGHESGEMHVAGGDGMPIVGLRVKVNKQGTLTGLGAVQLKASP